MVIDPGHGGDSLGGNTDEYIEKYINAKVAEYMRERLSEYDGVEVRMTRTDPDADNISIEDRVKLVASYDADFLVSVHFNMSVDHNLFGSEVWVSAFGDYYRQGVEFAKIEMEGLTSLGFFDRGIKTRIGKTGADYYGIMRYACEHDIPAVIIEHCHMDESRDTDILKAGGEEIYRTFGYMDADSVAKYYHLKSGSLGVDYSNYTYPAVETPVSRVGNDTSAPVLCEVTIMDCNTVTGKAIVRATASDDESVIQYYQLSYDGGATYGSLYPWSEDPKSLAPSEADSIDIPVELSEKGETEFKVRVFNRYDLTADSEEILLPAKETASDEVIAEAIDYGREEAAGRVSESMADTGEGAESYEAAGTEVYTEVSIDNVSARDDTGHGSMVLYALFSAIALAALFTVAIAVYTAGRRKRSRRRRT